MTTMTVTVPARAGLTVETLARRIGRSLYLVDLVLADSLDLGLVEQDGDGRWRLTDGAELRYGAALRSLTAP